MSNTSRRRANTSRRRVAMAAGAILAGAAIPIAATGTAWADETSDLTVAPKTETVAELERQGLSAAEARAVYEAEQPAGTAHDATAGTAVQVSFDGSIVVNANNSTDEASATSGAVKDVATAIGDGSVAQAGTGTDAYNVPLTGSDDKAFANGGGSTAVSGGGNVDNASATGTDSSAYASLGSHDTSIADGAGTEAGTGGSTTVGTGVILTAGSYDTARAYGAGDTALAGTGGAAPGSHDTALVGTATRLVTDSEAEAVAGEDDTARVVSVGRSTATDSFAYAGNVADDFGNSPTGFNRDVAVVYGSDDTASATDHSVQTVIVHAPAEAISAQVDVHVEPSAPILP